MQNIISLIEDTIKAKEEKHFSLLTQYSVLSKEIEILRTNEDKAKDCSLYHYLNLERQQASLSLEMKRLSDELNQIRNSLTYLK